MYTAHDSLLPWQAGADVVYAEGLNGPHELRALAEALEQRGVRG